MVSSRTSRRSHRTTGNRNKLPGRWRKIRKHRRRESLRGGCASDRSKTTIVPMPGKTMSLLSQENESKATDIAPIQVWKQPHDECRYRPLFRRRPCASNRQNLGGRRICRWSVATISRVVITPLPNLSNSLAILQEAKGLRPLDCLKNCFFPLGKKQFYFALGGLRTIRRVHHIFCDRLCQIPTNGAR